MLLDDAPDFFHAMRGIYCKELYVTKYSESRKRILSRNKKDELSYLIHNIKNKLNRSTEFFAKNLTFLY